MRELFRSTTAYRAIARAAQRGEQAHFTFVLFPDAVYLRSFLTLCAQAFFGAEEGRTAKLIAEESYADCIFCPARGAKLTAEGAAGLLGESALSPVEGDKKLFVLDAFHQVTPLVQNKLLKVLEEPPEGVYFLAGATAEHTVLPTILSRAEKIAVPPFSAEVLSTALRRLHPGAREIAAAAAASGGLLSAAEELLSGGGAAFRLAVRFLTEEDGAALSREAGAEKSFLPALRLVLRDVALYAAGQGKYAALRDEDVRRIAGSMPAGAALSALGLAARAERDVQFNTNPAQAAFMLYLRVNEEKRKWQKLS